MGVEATHLPAPAPGTSTSSKRPPHGSSFHVPGNNSSEPLTVTIVTCNTRYMETRKQQLVDAAIDYLLAHGLADLSLRPLAAEIGTSARLLIYHFESKEGMLAEVLEAMQARLRVSFIAMTRVPTRPGGEPLIMTFWKWATSRNQLPYLKLFYELQILAARNPPAYAKYLKRHSVNWLELIENALPPHERNPAMSTLLAAVFDGLFLELMSTGDRKRTTQALARFIDIVLKARAATAAG